MIRSSSLKGLRVEFTPWTGGSCIGIVEHDSSFPRRIDNNRQVWLRLETAHPAFQEFGPGTLVRAKVANLYEASR